jgi:exodeoxyribonuclease V gamma subunit
VALLDDLVDEASAEGRPSPVELGPADIRSLIADRLRGRPTRANFRTGNLTICTLVPMRSVPHRVVCLLGLDDGVFPRPVERDGDDLIVANPEVGDNDPRTEDRQLLLDALLSATDRVIVTYTARDERTNLARPPAVPLGELLDVIDRTVVAADGRPARDHLTIRHPLHPFDARNFTPGALVPVVPWSFDRVNLDGALALALPRQPAVPWLDGPLPPLEVGPVELDRLERFVGHPVRAFLRFRLGVSLADWSNDVDDTLPIELDGLERWGVGERLLGARLAGATAEAAVAAERARGLLPPGRLADAVLDVVAPAVEDLVRVGRREGELASRDVHVSLPDGSALVGTVAGLRGHLLHGVTYSVLGPRQRLVAWVRLLALTAAWPEMAWQAVTIGRGRRVRGRDTVRRATVGPLGLDAAERRDRALEQLETLVDLFRRGMAEPLPLYTRTSAAWAEAGGAGDPAEGEWTSGYDFPREDKDPEHLMVLGGQLSFAEMVETAGPIRDDESGGGWDGAEDTRFGRYARRLWGGLLAGEELVEQ